VTLHVARSHTRTKHVVTRRVFESPNAFDPLREFKRSPDPLAAIEGGVLLLREREGKGKGKKRGGRGKGRGRGSPLFYLTSGYGSVEIQVC